MMIVQTSEVWYQVDFSSMLLRLLIFMENVSELSIFLLPAQLTELAYRLIF
jgi:hypothetical protein